MIYIALIIALFLHNLAPMDVAWAIGWNVQNIVIAVLSAILWHKHNNSVCAVLSLFCGISAVTQWFGVNLSGHYMLLISVGALFVVWGIKQATIFKLESDPISTDTYMYGLSPVDNIPAKINVLRPSVWAEYGSRVIRAGDYVYFVHRGKFKKSPIADLSKTNLKLYTWIDSGVKLNPSDSSVLDNKLKERFIIFVNDCSSLHVSRSLGYILLSRFLNKVCRNG